MSALDFLQQYAGRLIYFVLLALIAVIQIVKYGKVSKQTKIMLEEADDVKYRLENYKKSTEGQTFKTVVPEYQLDEKSNQLVVVGTKDLQELVQSSADCALKAILDKFGCIPEGFIPVQPQVSEETDEVNVVQMKEDLDYYTEVLDFTEDLRERYHFDDGMSLDDMIKAVGKMKSNVDTNIQSQLEKQAKEGKKDEKKTSD